MSEDNLTLTVRNIQAMMAQGWTAAAIAAQSEVNQITVGNIKNGKASRVTDKVSDKIAALRKRVDSGSAETPRRGRKPAEGKAATSHGKPVTTRIKSAAPKAASPASSRAAQPAAPKSTPMSSGIEGMINTNYVPVDIVRLQAMIDRLIDSFGGAISELEQIKSQLKM
ncbi:MAG: hypothetical protein WBQ23_00620 [Bacteroidota bacterium]